MTRAVQLAQAAAGGVLQVVSGRNGDFYSTSSVGWVDIPSLTATITPSSANSKILIQICFGRASTASYNLDYTAMIRVLRNGDDNVAINGNTASARWRSAMNINGLAFNADHSPGGFGVSALDSPVSTSALTYKVQVVCQNASYPFTMNGAVNNSDSGASYHCRTQASIILTEIAG